MKKRSHDADDDYGRGATVMTTNDGPKEAKLDDIVLAAKKPYSYLVQILHFMYYMPAKNCVIHIINMVTSLKMTLYYLIATKMI